MRAYHFSMMNGLTQYTHEPIVIGQRLEARGPLSLCRNGLHGSKSIGEALTYAPGCLLHVVELEGEILEDCDKCCAQYRTALVTVDFTEGLKAFAYWCAERTQAFANEMSTIAMETLDGMKLIVSEVDVICRVVGTVKDIAEYASQCAMHSCAVSTSINGAAVFSSNAAGAALEAASAVGSIVSFAQKMVGSVSPDPLNVSLRSKEWYLQEDKLQELFTHALTPTQKEAIR